MRKPPKKSENLTTCWLRETPSHLVIANRADSHSPPSPTSASDPRRPSRFPSRPSSIPPQRQATEYAGQQRPLRLLGRLHAARQDLVAANAALAPVADSLALEARDAATQMASV
ncbi:hypothetical protein XA68_10642 [Ophiocordyceps unilateralis]|uniref:Uncharacterized protein n=1 Tax=Ophiocordyceps unilateralis TaxID=268505 RepID=A0A2A9P2N4_OPHUN|nr:hypothetical protein XA68_10642 [Ophiocordyceps unilateralis]